MTGQPRFQKDGPLFFPTAPPRSALASRLRPHELIAMLTHHYTRVRARSLPKVTTTLCVSTPRGKQAVIIGWGG